MRHWERAPRAGRGIIVTRASVCICVAIRWIARVRFTCYRNGEDGALAVSFFTHVFTPPSARDVCQRRYVAPIVPRSGDLIKYGGIDRNWWLPPALTAKFIEKLKDGRGDGIVPGSSLGMYVTWTCRRTVRIFDVKTISMAKSRIRRCEKKRTCERRNVWQSEIKTL